MATVRARCWRVLDINNVIAACCLGAFASGFLSMGDADHPPPCVEHFRLNDLTYGAPALLLLLVTLARIVTGHRGGVVRRLFEACVVFLNLLVLLMILVFDGPGHDGGLATHVPLFALLAIRAICARLRRCAT